MEVAEKLCDRIGIIHKGRLIACGTMAELQARNRGRAVAGNDLPGADGQMKKLLRLVRVGLRVNFGLSVLRPRELLKKKKDLWIVPLIGLGLVGLAPVLVYYLKGLRWVYDLLVAAGPAGGPPDLRPAGRPVPHPRLRVLLRHLVLLFLARPGRSSSPCR